ncbi:DUF1109 domain-containing protein [Guyparkeria hydrothermalis]|uniref:DUF1109 domain-containing protein n=1 Tax=Guyparkeria hydrothermalis TaxID=923 RepID=UPI002021D6F6|nr:DUF1109 domain-containing protein [Guyparkeria hydrothermalis]MCL7745453.1 DUF1109 domain-containing protein [Guyparkeria hydrothermalis]
MKTEQLVSVLAAGEVAVPRRALPNRLAMATATGLLASLALMLGLLGIRPDLSQAAAAPMFWIKIGFAGLLAVAGLAATLRLGHPGLRLGRLPTSAAAVPVLLLWMLAIASLSQAAPSQRATLLMGETWSSCAFLIALLSAPLLASSLWAMRGMAPTRLRLAGAAAGLFAGSLAALVYSVHCPEMSAPFIATWYLLGILIPTGMGAWFGPRLLRW